MSPHKREVFTRANQHPAVAEIWEDLLRYYRFCRRDYGQSRYTARTKLINLGDKLADRANQKKASADG